MRCELFRTDPAALIDVLGSEEVLRRYLAAQEAEVPVLADRQLVAHLRRLNGLAARALTGGITVLAKQDAAAADQLLTDLLAVATWHGWELPLAREGETEVDVAGLPRGLLGADPGLEGAAAWVVDHGHVALARLREASDSADWSNHHHHGPCSH